MRHSLRVLITGAGPSEALAEALRGLGHAVRAVTPPERAAAQALEYRPDLVLADLDGDPARLGVEAAERCNAPVVCLVGPAAASAAAGLPQAGRADVPFVFAVKPVAPLQLRLSIDAVLAAQARERTVRDGERREAALQRRVAALERDLAITRTVFDALHQPVLALDQSRRFLMVNAAARGVVGETAADHDTAFHDFEVFAMDGRTPMPREEQPIERATRGEAFTDVEVLVKAPGQTEANVCISITGRPLRDAGGDLMGAVLVIHNVTRIKETEKRLQETIRDLNEQRRLMDAVLDTMHEAVVAIGVDGDLLVANRAARSLSAGPPSAGRFDKQYLESRGYRRPDGGRFAFDDLPLSRAVRGEELDGVEVTIPVPGRAEGRYVSVGGGPLRDGAGAVRAGVLVISDVTDIRKRELELQRTSTELHRRVQLLDAILRSMSDGVVVVDRNARLTYVNDRVERLLGVGLTELPPDEWVELYGLFRPDQVTPFNNDDLPLLRATRGESSDNVEMFVRNAHVPRGVFISVDGRPLRDPAGEVSGGVAVVRDLSQHIAAREAFVNGRLEVVDTVLHNVGNAMNSVTVGTGTLHAALRDNELVGRLSALAGTIAAQGDDPVPWLRDDPRGRQAIPFLLALAADLAAHNQRLLQTADRVRDRVQHIDTIIRTQQSHSTGRAEPQIVDLKRQVADVVRVLREMLAQRDIDIEVDCAAAPEQIRIHESRFHQMLVNLVRNAIEALDARAAAGGFDRAERPRIRIAARLGPEFLAIDVADNGIGIDPGKARSIFAAGYTTKKTGTGLGLHSAANFVIGLGGRIMPLDADAGPGTTMRVMLPRACILPTAQE